MGELTDRLLSGQTPTKREQPQETTGMLTEALLSGKTSFEPQVVTPSGGEPITGMVETGEVPTGAISTITGKPLTSTVPQRGADFTTLFKAGFVDNPEAQIPIFARSRFPDLPEQEAIARYGMTEDGNIVFRNERGVFQPETPATFLSQAKNLAARTGSSTPSIVMGSIGALGGPGIAALGAGGGEAIRKLVGHLVFDEPQTALGNALDIGLETVLGAAGEVGSGIFTGAVNKTLGLGTKPKRVLRDLIRSEVKTATPTEIAARREGAVLVKAIQDPEEMARLQDLATKHGIDLNIAEVAGSRDLLSLFNLLGDLDNTADLIQQFKKTQNLQIQNAIPNFLDTIAAETNPFQVGNDIVRASRDAIKGLKSDRAKLTKPFYDKAFASREDILINTDPAIGEIDDLLTQFADPKKDPSGRALLAIKDQLIKSEGDIVKLDRLKRSGMDTILNQKKADPTLRGEIQRVKNNLVDAMDIQNPSYAQARLVHGLNSPPVEAAEKGLTGALAKLEGDNVQGAAVQLLASKNSRPEAVKRAKALIGNENPEAWNAAVRDFLQFKFEALKDSQISDISNIGGALRKAVFGNENQRKIMKEALSPQQFKNLSDFMDVLQKTGLTFGKESATATRQEQLKGLQRTFGSEIAKTATRPLRTPERVIADRIDEFRFKRGTRQIAELLLSPDAETQIKQMKLLSPRSEQLIKQVAVFMGIEAPEVTEAITGSGAEEVRQ